MCQAATGLETNNAAPKGEIDANDTPCSSIPTTSAEVAISSAQPPMGLDEF
jgi:hypothetical protein